MKVWRPRINQEQRRDIKNIRRFVVWFAKQSATGRMPCSERASKIYMESINSSPSPLRVMLSSHCVCGMVFVFPDEVGLDSELQVLSDSMDEMAFGKL